MCVGFVIGMMIGIERGVGLLIDMSRVEEFCLVIVGVGSSCPDEVGFSDCSSISLFRFRRAVGMQIFLSVVMNGNLTYVCGVPDNAKPTWSNKPLGLIRRTNRPIVTSHFEN